MEEVQKYKLYVGKVQIIPDDIKYSYVSGHNRYMLVYSDKEPEGKFTELPDKLLKDLTQAEKEWLLACKLEINAKFMKDNEQQSLGLIENFLDNLEKELKKETAKIKRKANKKG